jgi:AbiV family abortive infection protein
MNNRTFLSISSKECGDVYKDILLHSEQKWESGKRLAETNDFGGAISIAIISIEELIKALIVFIDSKGFEFRKVKGMNTFFTNHQIRYFLAYLIFAMGIFGDEIFKLIKTLSKNPKLIAKLNQSLKENNPRFKRNMLIYLARKIILLRKEFEWFSKVDVFRQEGFYSDFHNTLKSPLKISPAEYEDVIVRLGKVKILTNLIIEAYNTSDKLVIEQITNIKIQIKENGVYNELAGALTKTRKTRETPFALLKSFFDDIDISALTK